MKTEKSSSFGWGPSILLFAAMIGLAAWGISLRMAAHADVTQRTEAQIVRTVKTMIPGPSKETQDLVLPGNVQAYYDAPIYARTNGYLKRWLVDIGAQVKAGQLLAEIDSPEVDQQLAQAQADLVQAQSNETLAQTTAERWTSLLKTKSVSQQETDEKVSDAAAKKAAREAVEANVARLRQLQGFEQVYAPFDGVVTQRNTDIGDLINAGSASGRQLFRVAATGKLWVYVNVPETYAAEMTPDIVATLNVTEHPELSFPLKLASTSEAVDQTTRTLLVQLEADNSKGQLLSGSYAQVHFALPPNKNAVRLPVSALLFRADGMTVATVDQTDHVAIKDIKIGRDFGNEVEVVAGLDPDDRVIINVPDSIANGEQVRLLDPEPKDTKHE